MTLIDSKINSFENRLCIKSGLFVSHLYISGPNFRRLVLWFVLFVPFLEQTFCQSVFSEPLLSKSCWAFQLCMLAFSGTWYSRRRELLFQELQVEYLC